MTMNANTDVSEAVFEYEISSVFSLSQQSLNAIKNVANNSGGLLVQASRSRSLSSS